MWNPVRKQRGLYTIPRLRIEKEGYAITEELKNISGAKCALKAFNETIENQVNGKNTDYSQESIIVRDQNGGERIANGYDVCRSLGEVVNCTLVFDTGYAFNNGDKLKACLKIHPNKDRQNRGYPYVADLCWQARGDAGRKNVFPACVANLDNVAKIIARIYGGVEKTARVAIHYAFLTMSEDDVGLGKTWVALDKCDIELSFAECNGKSRFPCYVIDARALRENPLCPAIYRSLPISLGLLRDSSLLEKLQRLLPDTDERFPCGWNHWVETEKGFSCDGPVGCSLAYYLEGVLERLCADRDSDSNASGAFVDDVDRSGFWFCTGLVGKTGDFLYGHVCKPDDDGFCQHIEWYTSNDKALPNQHPVSPDWTRSAQELVYNRDLLAKIALKEAVWHVWDKHRERLPLEWRKLPFPKIVEHVKEAFKRMCLEAYGNYRIVIPGFYKGKLSLLFPLHLGSLSGSQANAYLVINNDGERYHAPTILTPAMAFYAARIVTPQATLEWEQSFFAPLRDELRRQGIFSHSSDWEQNLHQLKEFLEVSK